MYAIISIFSFIIRTICLPNPFENLAFGLLLQAIISGILHPFTYAMVGIFYEKKSEPASGSMLYLIFYSVHTMMMIIWSMFNFSILSVTIVSVIYVIILIGIINIKYDSKWRMN